MPLLSIVRFFAILLSLLILATGGYLLWSWYQGEWLQTAGGDWLREREAWRLWAGAALLAVSFLGRPLALLALARSDERRTGPERGRGETIESPTGASLYVETHGRSGAPLIIFTHGWGMDSTFWRYAVADLSDRFELVLWDLPGLGRSKSPPDGQIRLERFARDLAALVERSGRRRAVLVGHSIGGMTIQTLLRDHPQIQARLAGVVLLNTTFTNPLRTMVFSGLATALQRPVLEPVMRLVAWLQPLVWVCNWQSYLSGGSHLAHRLGFGRFVTRSQLEHVTLLTTRNPPAVQARGNMAMFHWDAGEALRGAGVPVLVVGGDKDIVTKLEASRAIAQQSGQADLRVIEGVNHLGPMERADLYNAMIGEFTLAVQPSATEDVAGADDLGRPAGSRASGGGDSGRSSALDQIRR